MFARLRAPVHSRKTRGTDGQARRMDRGGWLVQNQEQTHRPGRHTGAGPRTETRCSASCTIDLTIVGHQFRAALPRDCPQEWQRRTTPPKACSPALSWSFILCRGVVSGGVAFQSGGSTTENSVPEGAQCPNGGLMTSPVQEMCLHFMWPLPGRHQRYAVPAKCAILWASHSNRRSNGEASLQRCSSG